MAETTHNRNGLATPIVSCITVGSFAENCYLYACPTTREAVIIDPGDEGRPPRSVHPAGDAVRARAGRHESDLQRAPLSPRIPIVPRKSDHVYPR